MRKLNVINTLLMLLSASLTFFTTNQSAINEDNGAVNKKSVIVFGGNGFIGAATVEKLVREKYFVVIINRGTWYWDSETRIKPYVFQITCDRADSLQNCQKLQLFLWNESTPSYFDVLIDFSGYDAFQITDTLRILDGKIMKYVYISSDSVYDVSNKTHNDYSREEDSVRPDSASERDRLKQKENYGHRKLECEEELLKQSLDKFGVPFISLRLPDVVGPRDNTYRWWLYQLWVKMHEYIDRPLSVPRKFWNQPMSFVYVDDVADAIMNCVVAGQELNNEAFNLAQDEMPTLVEYLHTLMDILDMDDVDIQADDTDQPFYLFPSVTSGPVDTSKAKAKLKWDPVPWHDVVFITVDFYEKAMKKESKFEKEKKNVIRTLQEHFSKDPINVLRGLEKNYGLDFGRVNHDEL